MKAISVIMLAIVVGGVYIFTLSPSNTKDWEVGFEVAPEVQINSSQVTIKNIRDWNYSKTDIISKEYIEDTYYLDDLTQVWFLVEPFSKWDGIAHTYFVFDFADKDPLSFSIEARREKGEEYNAFIGAFNKYELIYMWGTERDFTGRRIYKDNADVYMYPLELTPESAQKLFLELATATKELRTEPKFYNTLTSNCTNNLANHANKVQAGTIPFHYARILPGYSDELLYELKYIPTNEDLEEVKRKHYITDIVNEIYTDEDFSTKLRNTLNEDTTREQKAD